MIIDDLQTQLNIIKPYLPSFDITEQDLVEYINTDEAYLERRVLIIPNTESSKQELEELFNRERVR